MKKLLYRILKKDMIKNLSEKHGNQFVDDVMTTFGMPTDTTNDFLKTPNKIGEYICRMDNAYIKMCYWNGQEWLDMWKSTLEGKVINWIEIPTNL